MRLPYRLHGFWREQGTWQLELNPAPVGKWNSSMANFQMPLLLVYGENMFIDTTCFPIYSDLSGNGNEICYKYQLEVEINIGRWLLFCRWSV